VRFVSRIQSLTRGFPGNGRKFALFRELSATVKFQSGNDAPNKFGNYARQASSNEVVQTFPATVGDAEVSVWRQRNIGLFEK